MMGESESEQLSDSDLLKGEILDELIGFTAELLARRMRKGEIKKLIFKATDQKLSPPYMERLLCLARDRLREALKVSLEDQSAKALGLYEYVISNTESDGERLRAQDGLNEMLGIGARFGTGNKDPREQAIKVRDVLREMRESTEVEPPEEE